MKSDQQQVDDLPRQLPDGLLLRWATVDDSEELAQFNLAIHSDDPNDPELFLTHWTRDLMSGIHPTTDASDFTVVVDTKNDNRIVSSLCTISQVWTYGGIAVPVGRPELVGTHPDYRRRGLVRMQMELIHAKSAARGELMSIITGIPWYYRQFGYEMTVGSGGSRHFVWAQRGNDVVLENEIYTMRPAAISDIPVLDVLKACYSARSLLTCQRPESHWRYQIEDANQTSVGHVDYQIVEDSSGKPVAYLALEQWRNYLSIVELGVADGHSWRAVALYLTRALKLRADELNKTLDKPITSIGFVFGTNHAVYDALGSQLGHQSRPYAYYIRVPDIIGFLHHITPVLEARLAVSVLAGHTGSLKVSLYLERFEMTFEDGKLQSITPFDAADLEDGDIRFPDLSFLHILFGYRSYEELHNSYTDCYASSVEARLLTEVLFPKQTAYLMPLN